MYRSIRVDSDDSDDLESRDARSQNVSGGFHRIVMCVCMEEVETLFHFLGKFLVQCC